MLFYTGWLKLLGKDNKRFGAGAPGLGRDGARYLASLGVAMVGSDTWSFEVIPFEKDAGIFEVHQILIPLNGIHILENINTEEMARSGLGISSRLVQPESPAASRRSSIRSQSSEEAKRDASLRRVSTKNCQLHEQVRR